jgi:aspartate/tyrosine/aromatic aminotransferase
MTEEKYIQKPDFALFDHIMETNNLKNDARLYDFFDKKLSKPDISRYRHKKKKMSPNHILVIHEKLGMPVAEIRNLLAQE